MPSFKNFKILIFFIMTFLLLAQWADSQESATPQENFIKITDRLYMLKGAGCNIASLLGQDGVLLIDSGAQNQSAMVVSTMKEITDAPVRMVINTHYHFDHAGGNEAFARKGAITISHLNTRNRMTQEWRVPEIMGIKYPTIPPYPEICLPKITFDESLTIHFNDEIIHVTHIPGGHSDSDIIIQFRKANVIHTGDLYLSNGFPIIDFLYGGSVNGYIAAVGEIIQICNENTRIIPGHGPLSNREELITYRDMLVKARDRIVNMIEEGQTLEEIVTADPISELCKGGKSWLPPKMYIYCVYHEFSNQ